jgi:phage gp16-like protein
MPMKKPDHRRAELGAIHIAKKQLGLDEETYRQMLWTVGRVRSAADLDDAGRARVIDHLRARGFQRAGAPRVTDQVDHGKKPLVAADRQPLVDKIEALLADGAKPWNYARAMAQRMFKLQLEWCGPEQLHRLVAALEYDKRRRRQRKPA